MKRLLSALFALCLILSLLTLSVLASDRSGGLSGNALVADYAELLTSSERQSLEQRARSISNAHGCEVIVLTVNSTGGKTAQDYADDYYVDHNYGFGSDHSGIMLLLDMGGRDWHVATRGSAISAFPDNDIDFMMSRLMDDLSGGNYYEAFETYYDYAEKILGVADGSLSQNEVDEINEEFNDYMNGGSSKPNYVKKGIWSVILGALGGFIPVSAQKSALKTVRKRNDASGYAKEGSLNLYVNRDTYLYSNVTSHVIQTQPRTDGGGGHTIGSGHSTTHTHSSGATFGGHGGKF